MYVKNVCKLLSKFKKEVSNTKYPDLILFSISRANNMQGKPNWKGFL